MRRDKKAAQKKKARTIARRNAQPPRGDAIMRLARSADFGPAFMSPEWAEEDLPPQLVTVVITRALPRGQYALHTMLVDRTCLGVKNAFSIGPLSSGDLEEFLDRLSESHAGDMEEVDVEVAQSVVLHAIAYAGSLGFKPHPDFELELLEPLPSEIEDTPLCRPSRPFYVPGPDDDAPRVLAKLRATVGLRGFDFGEPTDDELVLERAPDEAALSEAVQAWLDIAPGERLDMKTAIAQYFQAVTGEKMRAGAELDEEHATSLPLVWSALFRPLRGGGTGLDLARAEETLKPFHAELERVARSRAALFDVIGVVPERGVAIARDAFDGTLFDVRLGDDMLPKVTRWMRLFGYVTPMPDGAWYPPSALLGHAWLRNVEPSNAVAGLNELLAKLGIDERVDPASPSAGFTRFGALVHGVLHRLIAPTAEQAADQNRPMYCVNSDDERFELHEATLAPGPTVAKKLIDALSAADDFVKENGFGWTGEPRMNVVDHERIAGIEPQAKQTFQITANSGIRFERFLTRLSSLAGTKLDPRNVKVMRPWEHNEHAVAEETPNCRKVVMGMAVVAVEGEIPEPGDVLIDVIRRNLHSDVPALGGRPIDLVKEAAGRASVEEWLTEQELRGAPPKTGSAFLDLDELRRELGLDPVLGR